MYVSVAPRRSMNTWDLQYPHRTRVVDTSKEMGAPHFGQSTVATASPYAGGPHKRSASTGAVGLSTTSPANGARPRGGGAPLSPSSRGPRAPSPPFRAGGRTPARSP